MELYTLQPVGAEHEAEQLLPCPESHRFEYGGRGQIDSYGVGGHLPTEHLPNMGLY